MNLKAKNGWSDKSFTKLLELLKVMVPKDNTCWVDVFDGYHQQSFKLRAMIFCTINDFLAYENLNGYNVKGHHACLNCEQQTSYPQLKHGKKIVTPQFSYFD
uniref:Uncharacterized protein n=1 Tax=Cajanus cajan TaxID=3821 RepID=A0A151SFC6_CAJCA|nr:hypothetical protein KK1_024644 [Cajanus cajan]